MTTPVERTPHLSAPDAASRYIARGWAPIPIPAKAKGPKLPKWQDLRVAEADVARLFKKGCNVGVLLGEPSGGLVDIDLDHPLAVALADEFLPATGAEFGRDGKPRSHRLYVVSAPVETTKRQSSGKAMLVELRSTGCQTVFPGSVHPSGEPVAWAADGEPTRVSPGLLLAAVAALADKVERRLAPEPTPHRNGTAGGIAPSGDVAERARKYLAKVPPAVSGQSGHAATFYAACCLVQGFALDRAPALALLQEWNAGCQPPWSDKELEHKIDDALKQPGERGYRLAGRGAPLGSPERNGSPAMPTAQPWPELLPLDALDLPAFPTAALPDVLRRWVEAESHATQTPADLPALLALAVCSACIARRVEVEPRPGWREPVNLFAVVLLEPGNRKSAVFADATRPLRELEAELIEAARPEVARKLSERRQLESQLKRLEKLAVEKGDAEARHEAGELAAALAAEDEPALPRLIADDATPEKLEMMLAEQGGRMASMSPEGDVFDLMAGRYSKNGAAQFGVFLKGHAGDDLIVDRVGRKGVSIQRPALTCAFAVQPQVIAGLAENPAFRGRGLLGRFLYAAPRSWIGQREIAPEPMADAVREDFRHAVRALAEAEDGTTLGLTAEAHHALRGWEAEIESTLAEGGAMEAMLDWGAKLAGATLRLAAVMHAVERGPTGSIGVATLAAAVEIARYLMPHADAVLNMMHAKEGASEADASYLLRWVQRHDRREFTKSEAQQHGKRRFPRADDIDPALAELTRRGYIRPKLAEATGPGRPPSTVYELNPAASEN